MIRVRGLGAPLSVALLPHRGASLRLSIAVKVRYSFRDANGGVASLDTAPCAFRGDEVDPRGSASGAGDLRHASDLLPYKASSDLTVVGSACSQLMARQILARFSVGSLRREVVACSAGAVSSIPLTSVYLRTADTGQIAITGPTRATGTRLRRPRRASPAEAGWGPHLLDIPAAEDGTGFQCAPPEQQAAAEWDPGLEVRLVGLGPGAAAGNPSWFRLPGLRPFAFWMVGPSAARIRLRADTMHVDVDDATITVVHRGHVPTHADPRDGVDVLVAIARESADPAMITARANEAVDLPYTTFGADGSPMAVPAASARAPVESSTVQMQRPMGLGSSDLEGFAEAPGQTVPMVIGQLPTATPFRADQPHRSQEASAAAAQVFQPAPAEAAPLARKPIEQTVQRSVESLLGDDSPRTMPFVPVIGPRPPIEAPPRRPRDDEDDEGGTGTLALDASSPQVLALQMQAAMAPPPPLVAPPPPSSPVAAPPPAARPPPPAVVAPRADAPPLAPGPTPEEDEAPPLAKLSLEQYAAVRVELAREPDAPRAVVLKRFRLDPVSWAMESSRWARRLDGDAARGQTREIEDLLARIRQLQA